MERCCPCTIRGASRRALARPSMRHGAPGVWARGAGGQPAAGAYERSRGWSWSEAQVEGEEEAAGGRKRRDVLPALNLRLPDEVDFGVESRVREPREQVTSGDREARILDAATPEPRHESIRDRVADRQLADLHECRRLQ